LVENQRKAKSENIINNNIDMNPKNNINEIKINGNEPDSINNYIKDAKFDVENDLEIFRLNSIKLKENQLIKKENSFIPIKKQMDLIKVITKKDKIFNLHKKLYSDKIGKIHISVDYANKYDIFLIEEEINKSISHFEKANKRKRFLSQNYDEYYYDSKNDNYNHNQINGTKNNNTYINNEISDKMHILKNLQNSFYVEDTDFNKNNNSNKKHCDNDNYESTNADKKLNLNIIQNYDILNKNEICFNEDIKVDINKINNKINYNKNNKTVRYFENIIPNCSIKDKDMLNCTENEKSEKRINSKSEEKANSRSII